MSLTRVLTSSYLNSQSTVGSSYLDSEMINSRPLVYLN